MAPDDPVGWNRYVITGFVGSLATEHRVRGIFGSERRVTGCAKKKKIQNENVFFCTLRARRARRPRGVARVTIASPYNILRYSQSL